MCIRDRSSDASPDSKPRVLSVGSMGRGRCGVTVLASRCSLLGGLFPGGSFVEQIRELGDALGGTVEYRGELRPSGGIEPEDATVGEGVLGTGYGCCGDEVGERLTGDSRSVSDQGILIRGEAHSEAGLLTPGGFGSDGHGTTVRQLGIQNKCFLQLPSRGTTQVRRVTCQRPLHPRL